MDVTAILRMRTCIANARGRRRKGIGTAVAGSHVGDGHTERSRIPTSGSRKRKETMPYEESWERGRSTESATGSSAKRRNGEATGLNHGTSRRDEPPTDGGFTSPVSPNSRLSSSASGISKRAATCRRVTPSRQSSVRTRCHIADRSGGRPSGSLTPNRLFIWMQNVR